MVTKDTTLYKYISRGATLLGLIALTYFSAMYLFGTSILPTATAQSDRYLESRLNQIEQRFYMLESRLNRIEQDAATRRVPSSQTPDNRAQDLMLLQNELAGLRVRLGEVECGLLHLDERTLPAARRLGSRSNSGSDRCRQDWASPVYLSARP